MNIIAIILLLFFFVSFRASNFSFYSFFVCLTCYFLFPYRFEMPYYLYLPHTSTLVLAAEFLASAGLTQPQPMSTGTTICGVIFDGGLVLGADTRATAGTYKYN